MDNETRAIYRALADFSAARREVNRFRRDLAKLRAEEAAGNAASAKNRSDATRAANRRAKAQQAETAALKTAVQQVNRYAQRTVAATTAARAATKSIQAQNRALATNAARLIAAAAAAQQYAQQQRSISRNTGTANTNIGQNSPLQRRNPTRTAQPVIPAKPTLDASAAAAQYARNAQQAAKGSNAFARAMAWLRRESRDTDSVINRVDRSAARLHKGFQRFANWRPRLTPPFVALIPIIAGVVAAINPLIALLGAVGTAAFGLASNIASLSGAFLALPGILSAVVAGITSVVASMGGVGNVFKTYAAMQKATGAASGGSGQTAAERAEALADAEYNLAKAQRNVQKAQERLNDARKEALQDLIDLRTEVGRASLNEERAIADLQLAREAYNNVMADPGSTAGDKLDAAARIKEAEADLEDVRKKNIANQQALTKAEQDGIEGSEKVVDAREAVQDALIAQRDAQRALRQESAGGSAAVTAINEYNDALAELSPSARAVVLALIGLEDQWKNMRRSLQEEFFGQFVGDIGLLPQIIRNIDAFLRPAARSMGRFVSNFLNLAASPEWSEDFAQIGEQNGRLLDLMGDGALFLMEALKDLIIAAGPFTEWLVGSLAKGAENFRDLVSTGRETGSLAAWLEKVADRLETWWGIIKNVAGTLFNYGAAASGFGDWLSQGFLETTENWRKASEAAREGGSPFRQFLEDIKPLLSEVNGLFGDFFGWLSREMMDPANIEDAQDLVKLIRDDLGPAIGGFLDALAETDIDEKFIEALSSIIESLTSITEVGGGAAFESFFDVVAGFFEAVADFLGDLPDGAADTLLSIVGALAGVAFVGKFTGVTSGLGLLVGHFKDLDKLKFTKLLGAGGVFAGIAALAIAAANAAPKQAEYNQSFRDFATNPTQDTYDNYRDSATKDGNVIKNLGNIPGTNFGALGPMTNSLPIVTELLHGFDDLFGTNIGTEFENWLEDISNTFFDWIEDSPLHSFMTDLVVNWQIGWGVLTQWWNEELPRFLGEVETNWNNGWAAITTWFDTTFVQPVQQAWSNFQLGLQIGQQWINDNVIVPFQNGWAAISAWFDRTFVQPIKQKWGEVQTAFWTVWTWIDTNVLKPFGRGVDTLKGWINDGLNGIRDTWNRLRDIFKDPVKFVVETVYNGGILPMWNKVNDALKLNLPLSPVKLGYAEGGVLPGYTPGRDVHDFVSPTGGRLSLSGGEGIMRPEFVRAVGGEKGVADLNRRARRGQAFASGGVYKKSGQGSSSKKDTSGGDIFDKLVDLGTGIFSFAGKLFSDPVGVVTDGLKGLLNAAMSGMPNNGLWPDFKKIPSTLIDGLIGATKKSSAAQDLAGGGPAPANVMGWQRQWAAVKAAFPGANLNSAYRPGAITSTGSKSYHGQGRAIDVTPSMAIFNWIKENYPNSRELIYSPAGGRQLQNGREYRWGEPVRSQHFDHVHWAMRQGGVIPKLYDQGGWLPHGGAAINRSGKPEAVLTNEESRALKSLLSAPGLVNAPSLAVPQGLVNAASQAPQIQDNSINIENLTIQNPVPEKTSESLPSAIRRIGYMQNARTGS